MNNRRNRNIIFISLFLGAFIFSTYSSIFASSVPSSAGNEVLEDDFNLIFENSWGKETPEDMGEEIVDVAEIVANIDSFIEHNYSVYVDNEIPQEFPMYKNHYQLNATYLWVTNDHDGGGAGDMFLRGFVNKMIDDDMGYTMDWDFDLGEFNDGEHDAIDCPLFEGWAYDLYFKIELYDSDPLGAIDTFDTWEDILDTTNASTFNVTYGGDATVQFTLSLLDTQEIMTAGDLLDAYKPYLFSDVETSYDDPADYVFGRVIEGEDSVVGYNTTCLQYLYYFPYEYTGTDVFVHNWDWEMILIFIDFTQSRYPYRLVWDNGWYFTGGPSGKDWIDGQDYRIYDKSITPGTYSTDLNFTESLWPLLGKERTLSVEVMDIASVYDSGVEKWGWFEWGFPTFQATIETSYHQFDLGDAGGFNHMDMNRDYPILPMNNSLLRDAYRSLNTSFNEGVHPLDGYFTPNYAPFSWDVSQPFQFPYLFNNYVKLATDINAYNDAAVSKSVELKIEKEITTKLDVPAHLSMALPTEVGAGEKVDTTLNIVIDKDKSVITLNFWFDLNLSVNMFYWEQSWNAVIEESITINVGTGVITYRGIDIDTKAATSGLFSFEDQDIGDYCSLEGSFTPEIVGTLASAVFSISISEIIKTLVGPQYAWIIDLLVDDLSLNINPVLTGYMKFDLYLENTLVSSAIQVTQYTQAFPVSFTMPQATDTKLHLQIKNLVYGVNFAVDWSISLEWATIPALFLEDQEWDIGTWPSMDIDLQEGTAVLKDIAVYGWDAKSKQFILEEGMGTYNQPDTPDDDSSDSADAGIDGYSPLIMGLALFGAISLVMTKKSKNRV